MGRAERRAAARDLNRATNRALSAADALEKAYRQGWDEGWKSGSRQALQYLTAAACLALSDMYGFGEKRLYKVLMRMNQELLPSSPHLTTMEAAAEVLEKTGLELNFENPLESVCIVLKKKGSKQYVCKEHD